MIRGRIATIFAQQYETIRT